MKIRILIGSLAIGQLRAEDTEEKSTPDISQNQIPDDVPQQNQIPVQQERKSITLKEMLDRIEWAEGEVKKQDDAKKRASVKSQEEGGKTFLEYIGLSSSKNADAPTSSKNVNTPTSSKDNDALTSSKDNDALTSSKNKDAPPPPRTVKNLRGIGRSPGIGSSSSSGGNADSMLQKMSEARESSGSWRIEGMNGKEDQSKWCMNRHTGGGLACDTDSTHGPTDDEVKNVATLTGAKGLAKFREISICQINNVLPPDQIPKITLAQWKQLGIYQLWTLFGRWYTYPDAGFGKPMNITHAVGEQTEARRAFHNKHGERDEAAFKFKLKADQKVRQKVSNVQVDGTKDGVMSFVDFDDTRDHDHLKHMKNETIFHALLSHAFDPANDLYYSGYRDSDFMHFGVPRDLRSNMDSGLRQMRAPGLWGEWQKSFGEPHQRRNRTLSNDHLKDKDSIRAISAERFRLITIEQILGDENGEKDNTISNDAIKGITFEQWNSLDIPHLWVFAKRIVKDPHLRDCIFPEHTSLPAFTKLRTPAMKFSSKNSIDGHPVHPKNENGRHFISFLETKQTKLVRKRLSKEKPRKSCIADGNYKGFLRAARIDTEFVQRYIAGKSLLEFIFGTFKQDGYAERILDDDLLNDPTSEENKLNLITTIPANHFGNIKKCQIQKVLTENAVKAVTYNQWQSLNLDQLWFVVKRWHRVLMAKKIPKNILTLRDNNGKHEWHENDSFHGFETLPSRFLGKTMFDAILNIELDEVKQEEFIDQVVKDERIRHRLRVKEQIYYRYSGLEGYTVYGDPENTWKALFGSESWISVCLKAFSSLAYFRGLIKHKILPQYARFVLRGLSEIGMVDRQIIVANDLGIAGVRKPDPAKKNEEATSSEESHSEDGPHTPTNSINYECWRMSDEFCNTRKFKAYKDVFNVLVERDFALAKHYALLFVNSRVVTRNWNDEVYWPTMEYYTPPMSRSLFETVKGKAMHDDFADYKYEHTYGFNDWDIEDRLIQDALSYYRVRGIWRLFKEFLGFFPWRHNILVTPEENMLLESGFSLMLPEQELAEYVNGCAGGLCENGESEKKAGKSYVGVYESGEYKPKPPNGPEPNSYRWSLFKYVVNPCVYNQEFFRFVLEAFVFGYSACYVRPFWNFHNDQFLSDYGTVTTLISDNFLCFCNIARHCIDQTIAALFSTWPNFLAYWVSFYFLVDPNFDEKQGPNLHEMLKELRSSSWIFGWSWNGSDGLKKIPSAGKPLTAPGAMENRSIMQQSTVVWNNAFFPTIRDGPVTDNDSSDDKKPKYNKMQELTGIAYWLAAFRIVLSLLFHLMWIVCCCKGFKNLWWSLNLLEVDCCRRLICGGRLCIHTCCYICVHFCCCCLKERVWGGLRCWEARTLRTPENQSSHLHGSQETLRTARKTLEQAAGHPILGQPILGFDGTSIKMEKKGEEDVIVLPTNMEYNQGNPASPDTGPINGKEGIWWNVRKTNENGGVGGELQPLMVNLNHMRSSVHNLDGRYSPPEGGVYSTQQKPVLGLVFNIGKGIVVEVQKVVKNVQNVVGKAVGSSTDSAGSLPSGWRSKEDQPGESKTFEISKHNGRIKISEKK